MSNLLLSPGQMRAAADHVTGQYGDGYGLGVDSHHPRGGVIFDVTCHVDGSWFRIWVRPDGAVARLCEQRTDGQWKCANPAAGRPVGSDYLCDAHGTGLDLAACNTTVLWSPDHRQLKAGGGRHPGTAVYLPQPVASCVGLYRTLANARLFPDAERMSEADRRAKAEAALGEPAAVPPAVAPYLRMALDAPIPDPGTGPAAVIRSAAVTQAAWDLTLAMRARYEDDHPQPPVAAADPDGRCRHGVLFADECARCGP